MVIVIMTLLDINKPIAKQDDLILKKKTSASKGNIYAVNINV